MDTVNWNSDIVHHVMASSTRDTVSRMMRTCCTLNHEGARYLLAHDPYLTRAEQVKSLALFLRARNKATLAANRLYWLEGLSISSYYHQSKPMEEAFASALKFFFIHFAPLARRFVRLDIGQGEGEPLFSAEPELAIAISNLNTLRTFTTTKVAGRTITMLRALKSCLFHADISIDPELTRNAVDDPIATLANSQSSLRTLSLGWAAVASSPSPLRFPFLDTLSLTRVASPTTWHLVQAFPNLCTISSLDVALRVYSGDPDDTQEVRTLQRLRNIADQRRYGSWTSLRSFKGSLAMLFVLGLACHVSHVDIGNDAEPDESFDLDMLQAVFMDTRPTHLTLRCHGLLLSQLMDGLSSLCSRAEFQLAETCKLYLTVAPRDHDYDVVAFLDGLCEAMAPTRLDSLKLRIDWSYLAKLLRKPTFSCPALAFLQSKSH
ncbi:hypothetical protein OH76DRAFT_1482408 [Lentinus brumalis]|uniref:F-box domain-containing protein n=1 Tax=Lentinus brumalis TaxID=2498619 RepID=A0A371DCL4_9APHY|nr:hypothetical protein OH76DRAFT_1482408 [Polyporus brumalis]